MGQSLRTSRNFSNQFMRGDHRMQELLKDNHILIINDVAAILRRSKTHVSHVLAGKIPGIPRLTHIALWAAENWSVVSGLINGWSPTGRDSLQTCQDSAFRTRQSGD